ncbi:MAG: 30S ribosomal protein S1 [Deltaproteobacteria bacterium]|nr:30S ribosomal protein S1 [Deltaproteobacteria bacterium]
MSQTETFHQGSAGGADSFAALFEAQMAGGDLGREGEIVQGTVVKVQRDQVVVDIGGKSEGVIALNEFADATGQVEVKPGDKVDVYIEARENDDGLVTLSKEKADKMKVWDEISSACERDELIEGTISQRVKGGLSVTIRGGVKAFLPGSQVDLRPIRNLDKLIGQTYQFKVIKFNKKRGNIVLSRRVLLEKERDEMKASTLANLEEGKIVKGVIKNITEYGAFVDLGGIDGLLHITDMSWGRVNHPSELFQVGDEVTVKVLKYNPETERVSLGLKQTQDDPWHHAEEAYPPGKRVRGKVMSIADYGAFIELEPGVEGLVHVSEMSWTRKVKKPQQILEVGQEIECQVLEVDAKAKRISLGLKQLEPDPWTLFTDKYKPGDKVSGKVRSLTDYGAFVGIEEGVDGMVHKSDLSWTIKVNVPGDVVHKGDDVEAIILSINHDEKKVSLGIKQLWDDPWARLVYDYPAGQVLEAKVLSACEYAIFVELRQGVDAQINISSAAEAESVKRGEMIKVAIDSVDPVDRRVTVTKADASAEVGSKVETTEAAEGTPAAPKAAAKPKAPKAKESIAPAASKTGSTLGELIKQKLGDQLEVKK